ncbi:high affinity glucose transporter [Paramarasmius palmivorus]|uniref:High affinity glucose transporter n=1 Tax=Paramarasmius palmivorus TaxID=297713 RepID=A0AAW0BMY6_9AGAR
MGYNRRIASNPYIVGSFVCLGGSLFGMDISSMSGVLTNPFYLKQFDNPSGFVQGALVASTPAGSLIGSLAVTQLGDRLGRKKTIMLAALVWIVGSVLQCASITRGMLAAGRVIGGVSIGIATAIIPVYQSEIAPASIRGRLISILQWSVTWGTLVQYFVQFGGSYINSAASFRIPWGFQMVPAIVLFCGMFLFPESPRWLLDNDREEEARQILADLHGKGDKDDELVRMEFEEIKEQILFEQNEGAKSYFDLLKGNNPRRVFLGCSLQMWSQLTGISVMIRYYITYVFRDVGLVGRRAGLIAASVQYILNVVMTVPAIIYIDKWGRRPMLIAGLASMGAVLFAVGALQGQLGRWGDVDGERIWTIRNHNGATKAFAVTMGPVNWTYPAEIFSLRVRAKEFHWLRLSTGCSVSPLYGPFHPAFSTIAYKTYFIFGTFNFVACLHVIFMYPETVGRTLEEVEDIFAAGNVFSAWKIDKNVGRRNIEDMEEQKEPNGSAQGAIVASMPAGSFVGALAVTQLGDRLGRKKTIMLAALIWVIGSILQCAAMTRGMLAAGRVIAGVSVGIASAIVPVYQSEITAPFIRGRLVSIQQWSITWGILFQYFVQFGCSYIQGVASFRIPWGLQMIPAIVLFFGMFFFPESPRWLLDNNREEEALQILADLHGGGNKNNELVRLEFGEIKEQVLFEKNEGAKSYFDLLKGNNPRRVFLGCSLQMWSQLTGISVMM